LLRIQPGLNPKEGGAGLLGEKALYLDFSNKRK